MCIFFSFFVCDCVQFYLPEILACILILCRKKRLGGKSKGLNQKARNEYKSASVCASECVDVSVLLEKWGVKGNGEA